MCMYSRYNIIVYVEIAAIQNDFYFQFNISC